MGREPPERLCTQEKRGEGLSQGASAVGYKDETQQGEPGRKGVANTGLED